MYTYRWFIMSYSRNYHNIESNHANKIKKISPFISIKNKINANINIYFLLF